MVDSRPNVNVRSRNETSETYDYFVKSAGQTTWVKNPSGEIRTVNQQTTSSEGHLWPPLTKEEKKRDIGGAFETSRTYTEVNPSRGSAISWTGKEITGCAIYPGDVLGLPDRPSNAQLDAWGTTAIARVDPTKSVADMSVFLGELLREGIPSLAGVQLWKDRSSKARSAGGEYLNYQFGWVPLVSEIRSLASAVKNAKSILRQYERDAGRLVRRRYDFPIEHENTLTGFPSHGVPFTAQSYDFGGQTYVRVRSEDYCKKWFSGAFTYWLPDSSGPYAQLDRYVTYADKLLGIELTPETLWNLAPWSWAVDWFANVGDVLHNVSAFDPDRLVMKYGYLMYHRELTKAHSWGSPDVYGGNYTSGSWKSVSYRKIRRPATPYGFGLELGSLTNYQWSILAALGLTKGPRLL